jgi:hypothetical protein
MRFRRAVPTRWIQAASALTVVMAAAMLLTIKVGAQDANTGYVIIRASYGWRDLQADVTDILRDRIARRDRVVVNNGTMGVDPAKGQDKTLRIIARGSDGAEREFTYREGDAIDTGMFVLPPPPPPPARRDDFDDRPRGDNRDDRRDDRRDERPGVWIVRAYWGVQGRTANVTDLVRSMQRESGGIRMQVSNRSLGGDPAPGADKVLIVIYRNQGTETFAIGHEGDNIAIP